MMALETGNGTSTATAGPSEAQRARERRLRRFNVAFVYIPIGLAVAAFVALIGLLLWQSIIGGWFGAHEAGAGRVLASGLADTILLLAVLPCALVCPVLPLLFFAGILAARRQGKAPLHRLRQVFWSLDDRVQQADGLVNQWAPRVIRPLVSLRSQAARLEAAARRLLRH